MRNKEELRLTFHPPNSPPLSKFGTNLAEGWNVREANIHPLFYPA